MSMFSQLGISWLIEFLLQMTNQIMHLTAIIALLSTFTEVSNIIRAA